MTTERHREGVKGERQLTKKAWKREHECGEWITGGNKRKSEKRR